MPLGDHPAHSRLTAAPASVPPGLRWGSRLPLGPAGDSVLLPSGQGSEMLEGPVPAAHALNAGLGPGAAFQSGALILKKDPDPERRVLEVTLSNALRLLGCRRGSPHNEPLKPPEQRAPHWCPHVAPGPAPLQDTG